VTVRLPSISPLTVPEGTSKPSGACWTKASWRRAAGGPTA